MDATAFWPNDNLRHIAWERLYTNLSPHEKMVEYLKANQVYLDQRGYYHGDFFSSLLETDAGFSTYAGNALESLWKVLDGLHGAENQLTLRELWIEFNKTLQNWKVEGKFKNVTTILTPDMLLSVRH